MARRRLWLILSIGCALLPPAPCKERLVRRLSVSDGLSSPPVWALAHDRAGFPWIGASGGLARYDGDEVRPWGPT